MPNVDFIVEMLKQGGLPVMMFIIFILYHRGENAKWAETITNQEKESQRIYDLLKSTVELQGKETERQFTLLQSLTETLQYHANTLVRVETKIDNNQFCPISKKETKP